MGTSAMDTKQYWPRKEATTTMKDTPATDMTSLNSKYVSRL